MAFGVREIQPTPNPNAQKFVLDRRVSEIPTNFYSLDQAKDHDLGTKLMTIPGVSNVLLLGDFITVGKRPEARWSDINRQVKQALAAEN